MSSEESSDSTVSLKLLIDTKGKRVLFAEAGKDFVDFLFRILSLPIGTVINLLKQQELEGSLANLYQSIENLNDSYLQPNQTKDALLKPVSPVPGFIPLLALNDAPPATVKKHYRCTCSQFSVYVTDNPRAVCPNCKKKMATYVAYVAPPPGDEQLVAEEGGFVKGVVTYMVMDDLVVTPLSTISSITLLNKFNVKEVGSLEEKVVSFGVDEAVKLLNASLQSKKVLSDVFLEGMIRIK
ncbi:hypothetical protein PHJA_002666000 [Phtheirospermum japonicum]|uniref:DUF674 domain-containing protein n=1 Tax=Phtheirospermum japonicum TaxID=374723 RepID=A0A830D5T6_9LAMI|nr:hypothetical protein PHJA_002666000 [Phtheirospermum japonicum]